MNKKSVFSSFTILLFIILIMNNMFVNNGLASENFDEFENYEGNAFPNADPGGPYFGIINEILTFDGSNSSNDTIEYSWKIDSEPWSDWSINSTFNYIFSNSGAFTVQLKVKDNDGLISDPASTKAYINGNTNMEVNAFDQFPWIWFIDRWIYFTVKVQNIEGPDIFWYKVNLSIWKGSIRKGWLEEIHFETETQPLGHLETHTYGQFNEIKWKTVVDGLYKIKAKLDWGYGPLPIDDWFIVWLR